MKARIEKKLSKRIAKSYPSRYRKAWRDDERSELSYEQKTCVRHCLSVGGGVDYFGDGEDAYTVWADWKSCWPWLGPFEGYPEGHEFEHYPNTEGFKATTRNLLKLAITCGLETK